MRATCRGCGLTFIGGAGCFQRMADHSWVCEGFAELRAALGVES